MESSWSEKSLRELAQLSEGEALRRFFDGRNCRILFRLLILFAFIAVVTTIALLAEGAYTLLALPLVNLIVIRTLFVLRDRPIFVTHCRQFLVAYLVIQILLVKGLFFAPGESFQAVDFLLPFLILLFRLPFTLLVIPLAVLWGVSAGRNLVEAMLLSQVEVNTGGLLAQTILSLAVLNVAASLSRNRQLEFLDTWRQENRRVRERRRIQEELDDARRIQLSMLPRSDPKIAWLDVAGISIPAGEVGGDYYDYFKLSDSRQAVVVGDVAGHGIASGLLLSGIRSCLYLLQETALPPAEILSRLDRMVRQTTGPRVFVALLYVLFDHDAMRLTLSSAGHPPLLHRIAATGRVDEIVLEALPLGTALGSRVEERVVEAARGDVFLLHTDGIAETTNSQGEVYGDERLRHQLRQQRQERSAKEIRDALLSSVWNWKGDTPQTDDITLVVAKLR